MQQTISHESNFEIEACVLLPTPAAALPAPKASAELRSCSWDEDGEACATFRPSNNRQWRRHEERSEGGDLLFQLAPGYACPHAFGFSEDGFDTANPAAKVLPEFTWAASHDSRPAEFPTYSYDNLATDCSHAALYHLGEGICKARRICTSIPRWGTLG